MSEEQPTTIEEERNEQEADTSIQIEPKRRITVHRRIIGSVRQPAGRKHSMTPVRFVPIPSEHEVAPVWKLVTRVGIAQASLPLSLMERLLHSLIYPLKVLVCFWRFSHALFVMTLLTLLICCGVLEFVHLNKPVHNLYQVDVSNGATLWQHAITSPMQSMLVDAQGSVVNVTVGKGLHRLTAFDRDGRFRWNSFDSTGNFSIPSIATLPGTLLAVLGPNNSTSANTQNFQFTLYLFNRATGRIIWQYAISDSNVQNSTLVLDADARFLYVAIPEINSTGTNVGTAAELLALDKMTGIVRWHVFSQQESLVSSPDAGKLLVLKQQVIWQVAGTVYVLHAADGQVAWQRFIRDNTLYPIPQSQMHMAETAGILLVQRSYTYHALDLATGQELWSISDIATDSPEFPGGVVVADNKFLIYGGGILEAVRASDRQVLWSQKQLGTIQGLKISDDGSLVYIVVVNSIDEGAPTQALAALSTKSGTVLWTFEPFEQESFVHTQTDGFQYARNILFVSLCLPESQVQCHRERLYALNGANGEILWRVEASRIYDVRSSADGSAVLLQSNTSEWINLAGYFRS